MKRQIKLIIFDFWNTLMWKDHTKGGNKAMLKFLGIKMNHRKIVKIYESIAQTKKYESLEEPYRLILQKIGVEPKKELVNHIIKMRSHVIDSVKPFPETEKLLKQISKKYKLAVLTNTSWLAYKKFLETGFQKYFDYILPSFDYHDIKPSLKGFKLIMKKFNLKPEECIMVGDNPVDDIAPARKLGMNAILFKSYAQLKKDFREFSIKIK